MNLILVVPASVIIFLVTIVPVYFANELLLLIFAFSSVIVVPIMMALSLKFYFKHGRRKQRQDTKKTFSIAS